MVPWGGYENKDKTHLQLDATSRGWELMRREVPVHGGLHCQHQASDSGAPQPLGGAIWPSHSAVLIVAGAMSCPVMERMSH